MGSKREVGLPFLGNVSTTKKAGGDGTTGYRGPRGGKVSRETRRTKILEKPRHFNPAAYEKNSGKRRGVQTEQPARLGKRRKSCEKPAGERLKPDAPGPKNCTIPGTHSDSTGLMRKLPARTPEGAEESVTRPF